MSTASGRGTPRDFEGSALRACFKSLGEFRLMAPALLLQNSADNETNWQEADPDGCAEMTNRLFVVVH